MCPHARCLSHTMWFSPCSDQAGHYVRARFCIVSMCTTFEVDSQNASQTRDELNMDNVPARFQRVDQLAWHISSYKQTQNSSKPRPKVECGWLQGQLAWWIAVLVVSCSWKPSFFVCCCLVGARWLTVMFLWSPSFIGNVLCSSRKQIHPTKLDSGKITGLFAGGLHSPEDRFESYT